MIADPSPFLLLGGPVGVLLIHGLTSSASVMRPVGRYLHQRGLTVSALLLPGHGTQVDDLRLKRWIDWAAHTEEAWRDLKSRCEVAFIVGQSLGALLTLHLASHRTDIGGAVLLSTPMGMLNYRGNLVGLLKHIVHYMPKSNIFFADPSAKERHWEYDRVPTSAVHELSKLTRNIKGLLSSVTIPVLLIHSRRDSVASYKGARYVYDRIASNRKQLILVEKSGHVLPLDREWPTIAESIYKFIRDCLPRNMAVPV